MITPFFKILFITLCGLSLSAMSQSLSEEWSYTYTETEPGQEISFITLVNAGSDGSVAFTVTRKSNQNQIFWLRPKDDGSSPDAPLWTSGWLTSAFFSDVVAVRRNHLVYYSDRSLKSVTVDENGTPSTPLNIKSFPETSEEEGGDSLVFTVEQPRSPGYVFTVAKRKDERGFTLRAFRFGPAPAAISAVPTSTTIAGGNSLSISFRAALGINYQLQSSTNLTAENWQNVGGAIAGTGEIITLVQDAGEPKLFFRVVAL